MWMSKKQLDKLQRASYEFGLNVGFDAGMRKGLYGRIIKLESALEQAEEILKRSK